jgi:cytochrome oxidase assembly protein ShyY1
VDIIVPFYTHLNAKGEECGLMVNRGWVAHDLKHQKMHLNSENAGTINGVLYRGDAKTKYSKANEPLLPKYHRADPWDLTLVAQLRNREEAGQFMLLQIDTNEEARQISPSAPYWRDLVNWKVKPERH